MRTRRFNTIDGRSSNSLLLILFASRRFALHTLDYRSKRPSAGIYLGAMGSTSVPKFGAREYVVPTARALSDLEMIELQKKFFLTNKNRKTQHRVRRNMKPCERQVPHEASAEGGSGCAF